MNLPRIGSLWTPKDALLSPRRVEAVYTKPCCGWFVEARIVETREVRTLKHETWDKWVCTYGARERGTEL